MEDRDHPDRRDPPRRQADRQAGRRRDTFRVTTTNVQNIMQNRFIQGPSLRNDELILVIRLGTPVPKEETASSSRPSVGRMSLRRAHAQLLSEGGDLSISQFALEICTNIS